MQNKPLGAQISHMLKDRGVEVIFGIPGVHNQEMYRGIEEAGLQHVLARHEQGAGFMADGYARATGRPGVCYVITGPGVCNIMTPMGQAYSDSVPMLVISSCLDEVAHQTGQLHQMRDQQAAAGCVCEWSAVALTAQAAYGLIDRALIEFGAARARPKHIQVPIAVAEAVAPPPPPALAALDIPENVAFPKDSDVAQMLLDARRPVIVYGGGARSGAFAATELAARLGAAVFTTYAGRGIVAPDYALNFGSFLARPDSAEIFAMADVILAIGTELSEVDLWRQDLGHDCPMVRVDIDPSVLADRHRASHPVLGDARAFMTSILVPMPENETDWTAAEAEAFRQRMTAQVASERPGIIPVAEALRAVLPSETMIYSDMTQFAYAAKEVWPMARAGHWHHPYGFGTLGYAMPAAIGGKIGMGAGPVVAIAGDYGFQYTVQELGAAVELGLALPIIVWDNGKLGEIEDSMVRAQIAPNAVVQKNPDFCKLAEAYGAYSARPESLSALQKAVTSALSADAPTVIHVRSDIAQT